MMTQQNNSNAVDSIGMVKPLEYIEIEDVDLRIALQRSEQRILSYTQDMVDNLLAMAGEFRQAKSRLARSGDRNSQWVRWVARFKGISRATADNLARIGELERTELDALRSGLFAESGGIAGIAAYLSAPAEVQEQVQKGEVDPKLHDIRDAARAFREAQEARRRAEEAEQRAKSAEAAVQIKIQEAEARARHEAEMRLQEATAKLRREVDDAEHQATMRLRDVEEAQRQLKAAQSEWQLRLNEATTKATQQEKERLERTYNERMRDLQGQLAYQQRTAESAKKQAEELNERLAHARDSEAVRARWQMTAESLTGQILQAVGKFPSIVEVSEFGADEWRLLESLRRQLRTAEERLAELATPNATIIDVN